MTLRCPEPVGGLEWTVIDGDRKTVMTELGRRHAGQIAAWRDMPSWAGLVERAGGPRREVFDAVVAASRRLLPTESQELDWLAAGAGVPAEELWALNLRGDLGRDGTGCSDLCAIAPRGGAGAGTGEGDRPWMGHNEDGERELAGLVRLVTLCIDSDPAVTVLWYPGMLPANSFVTTSAGLSFGMDHVPVRRCLTTGAGRHLVARHAQRQTDGEAARRVLRTVPCAGGFAFDVADGPAGRADIIENAAGAVIAARAGARPLRHTNHLRLVDGRRPGLAVADDDRWLAESRTRLARLSEASPAVESAEQVVAALRCDGVLNRGDDLYTFATTVVDPAADRIWIQGEGSPWRGVLSAFAVGERITA
jgi:hypothetical protein